MRSYYLSNIKRNIVLIFLIILAETFSFCGFSQDLKQDLDKIQTFYTGPGYLTVEIKATVVQNGTRSEVYQAKLWKKDEKFFYDLKGSQMLMTPSHLLMIHQKEKNLLYSEITEKQYNDFKKNIISCNMDSIIATYDSTRFLGVNDGSKHYKIYSGNNTISSTDLFLDQKSGAFKKIIYHYDSRIWGQGYQVQIDFDNSLASFPDELLSENKYLLREGNILKPTSAYHHFNLILTNHED